MEAVILLPPCYLSLESVRVLTAFWSASGCLSDGLLSPSDTQLCRDFEKRFAYLCVLKRDGELLPSGGSLLRWLQWPGPAQTEDRS